MRGSHRTLTLFAAMVVLALSACATPEPTAVAGATVTTSPPSETTSASAPETTSDAAPTVETTATPDAPTPPRVPGPLAPSVTVALDDDSLLDLNDQYRPVMLFFWATWCHSCHQMMPMIDQIAADYDGELTIVAVARDSAMHDVETDVISYLASGNTRWTLDEDGTICDAFGIPANPITVLIVGPVEGARWFGLVSGEEIRQRLDEVLALYET